MQSVHVYSLVKPLIYETHVLISLHCFSFDNSTPQPGHLTRCSCEAMSVISVHRSRCPAMAAYKFTELLPLR